ncbi:polyketide synthase [Penicillium malachiteum]|uniref:polyketide synthase n=1 Tax=Penicillium malachiteum TaxID=1324776 RepID=UPI002546F2E0|nr:polyketide synthase [Penicillium malachiteum]KAJ5713479.1 polyketide synthase [Penicillium malachiteum]
MQLPEGAMQLPEGTVLHNPENGSNSSPNSNNLTQVTDETAIAIIGIGKNFLSYINLETHTLMYLCSYIKTNLKSCNILGCRLPGDISSPSQLWDFLIQERCAAGPVPSSRFNNNAYSGGKDEPATTVGPGGYFLKEDVRQFDNLFFGINNREAADMDPEQRKLLEVVFECFESAGYSLSELSGADVGCYVATFLQDYAALHSKDPEWLTRYSATGMGAAILANRVSHAFNLKGPSLAINTACSASIYALHQAVSALKSHECDSAVVAGVNLILSPDLHVSVSQGGVLGPTSVCHTFDESADGYGRAEAVNAIYIKRLDDAVRDGDPIRSIIRGVAVNSNGHTPGITQPSVDGQISVAQKTYRQARLKPSDTAYVEMHGTGTAVGDVMEAQSIAGVFLGEPRNSPLHVGGVKPNLGHSEAASGLTSVIKAILSFEQELLPPTIGVVNLNPKLQLDKHGIQLVTRATPFPKPGPGLGRRISINSFGFGGANAHGIIEDAGLYSAFTTSCLQGDDSNNVRNIVDSVRPYLIPFSANDSYSLEQRAERLSQLSLRPGVTADLAYTLGERRSHLKTRGYIIARPATLDQDLKIENLRVASSAGHAISESHKFLSVFTGQGAQWEGMADDLLQIPIFVNAIFQMEKALAALPYPPSWKISIILKDRSNDSPINEAAFAQPVTTAVQIGVVEVLRALGISTHGVIGHSSGEIAAAYAANMIDLREAITLAYYRGYAVTRCAPIGAMAAVGLNPEEAEKWIQTITDGKSRIRVACINSPESVTISGNCNALDALISLLTAEGIFARKLKTGGKAYHSHQMEAVGPTYETLLQGANVFTVDRISSKDANQDDACMFSTVLRQKVDKSEVRTASYWRQNLECPVHFSDGLLGLSALFDDFSFIEIGPHTAMKMPILQTLGKSTSYFGTLKRGQDSLTSLLELMGNLFTSGFPVSFPKLQHLYPTQSSPLKVLHDLPTYPWHYEKIRWNESRVSRESRERKFPRHELLGTPIPGGDLVTFGWRNRLRLDNVPWLRDHKLGEETVFPATGYLAMAVEALLQVREVDMNRDLTEYSVTFQHVDLPNALSVGDQDVIELYTEVSPQKITSLTISRDNLDFRISTIGGDTSTIRASGTIKLEKGSALLDQHMPPHPDCRLVSKSSRMWYESMHKCGQRYGPNFQHMKEILTPDNKGGLFAQATLESVSSVLQGIQSSPRYLIHPAILDNVLQAGLVASAGGQLDLMVAKVPKSFGRISLRAPLSAHNEATIHSASSVTGFGSNDVHTVVLDSDQRSLVMIDKMSITKYSGSEQMEEDRHPLYRFVWKPDIDHIQTDAAFSAAIDHVRSNTDLGILPNSIRDITMAIDLVVHKNPSADILFLSSDLLWAALVLSKLLMADTAQPRLNSFHLGQFSSDGQLEVAELQRFASPFEMESFSQFSLASPDQKFDLVVLDEQSPHLDSLAPYTEACTRIVHASPGANRLSSETFNVTHSLPTGIGSNVRILRPTSKREILPTQEFDSVLLIARTPSHEDDDHLQNCLSDELSLPVEKRELSELGNISISSSTLVVSTVELQHDIMGRATPEDFAAIQHVLAKPVKMVWVSGSGVHEGSDPTRAIFHGLARAIMIEQPATEIFSLELDPCASPTDISNYVTQVITRTEGCPPDYEYLQSSSGLLVSRAVPDEPMNDAFRNKERGKAVLQPLSSAGPVSLSMDKPGQLQSVQFVKKREQSLGPDDVLVKVLYIGLNAKDVYVLAGRMETPDAVCSGEYTGKVLAIGSAVRDLSVDDHVAVMYPGHFSTHEVVPSQNCVRLNSQDDSRSLASVPVVFTTALYALEHRAQLQPGESVLIHSATGGVGIAAIQIAKSMGAEIFATVGTEEKKKYLVENFGIQPDHILSSRDSSFAAGIRSLTNGRGVNVVLNSLVGELLLESWSCLADFGRFVEIGKKDIREHGRLPMDPFNRNATFTACDLSQLAASTSPVMKSLFHRLLSRVIFLTRKLGPALRHFNDQARIGKVLISFEDQNAMIPVVPERFTTHLHPDKSYLMVGCLGGLGRSLSQWMVRRGAKSFIFLGRSGTKKPAAKRLIEDLEQQGARCIVIQGDVTNPDDVEKAASAAPLPLGGVVHAAMGLHEAIFSEMTHEHWREGTAAKLEGAWNLHNALSQSDREHHLDFFVMTSSINGKIGTATESNYCAANNFLDVFARYRRQLGLPAVSIGLGAIAEIGYLHEHSHIEELLLRKGIRFLTESDVLQIFDLALSDSPTSAHPSDTVTQSLLLSGVEMTTLQRNHNQGYQMSWHSLSDVRFSILVNSLKRSSGRTAVEGKGTHESALRSAFAAKDEAQVIAVAQEAVTQKLSFMVLIPVDKINVNASLSDFAMDSMLASELRQHIFSVAKVDISFLTIMSPQTTVSSLCAMIATLLLQAPA